MPNEPRSENEIRGIARTIADSTIIDACLTFAALCHESDLRGAHALAVLDEWANALQETAQTAREQVEEIRAIGVSAMLDRTGTHPADAAISELLRLRRQQIRASAEVADPDPGNVMDDDSDDD